METGRECPHVQGRAETEFSVMTFGDEGGIEDMLLKSPQPRVLMLSPVALLPCREVHGVEMSEM